MAESVLGTFRVDKELWNNFQGLAKGSGSNASQAIVGLIQACIDGNIDIKNYTNIKPKPKPEVDNIDGAIDKYLDKNLDSCIHSYLDKNLYQLKLEVAILSDSNQKTLLELSYQRGDIEALKTSTASNIPTLETIKTEIEQSIEPVKASIADLEEYIPSQFAAVRDEIKKALSSRENSSHKPSPLRITEASLVVLENSEVVPDTESVDIPTATGECLTFAQLATQLDYAIPDGIKASTARKEDAEALLLFVGDKAIEYKWHSKSRKFYKNVIG